MFRTACTFSSAWVAVVLAAFTVIPIGRAQENRQPWGAPAVSGGWITYSSPALSPDGETVYVGVQRSGDTGGIVALSTSGGKARWVRNFSGPVDSSPVVGEDGTVYIGSVNGRLYALNPTNGLDRRPAFDAGSFISSSPAIAADGTLYFGTGNGDLVALSPQGAPLLRFATNDSIFGSPVVGSDGTIYFGSLDRRLYALWPDGREKWRFQTAGELFGSPAVGWDGTIYVGSSDQSMYAINPDGSLRWRHITNGPIDASPVLGADGTVYFGSGDTNFYALNPTGPDDGRIKWQRNIRAAASSTAAVRGDGVIVVGADDGVVRAFNPDDGSIRWTFSAQEEITSSPTIGVDGAIYFGSIDGNLYKLAGNGSPLSTFSSWPAFQRDRFNRGQHPGANGTRLVNLSARMAAAANDTQIAGFYVQGGGQRAFLLRAVGPTLAQFGVTDVMPDPRLDLFAAGRLLSSNDNWEQRLASSTYSPIEAAEALAAFPLPPGSKDAAMVEVLPVGPYTGHVTSANGEAGVVLIEAYDARGGDPVTRLVNLSVRSKVGVGDKVLIAGFVLEGPGPGRLLIRAIGPGLTQFGVTDALTRPTMTIYRGDTPLHSNTGWSTQGLTYDLIGAAQAVAAFPLSTTSADSALIVSLVPGDYTVQVSGVDAATGEALAEIYLLP